MADAEISAEDRETLVDMKFGQLFDKHFEEKFEAAWEKKVQDRNTKPRKQLEQQTPPQDDDAPPQRTRKRSLLEECFSQSFGW